MSGGLVALLDDVAAIARAAAASVDDVAAAAGRASTKAVGVVIDDTAVTPQYVEGVKPARELPMIWRIARGSLINKLVIILPIALLLSEFLPWALTPLLMLGGSYLCFEGMEKTIEKFRGGSHKGHGPIKSSLVMRILSSRQLFLPTSSCRPKSWSLASMRLPMRLFGDVPSS
ncbi:DUF808 family protein [Citricoccus muralis]|uniref:DUF808 family protein n=1 Tax=Citricoccus muralis TaxID=169134 RepID=UPI003242F04E